MYAYVAQAFNRLKNACEVQNSSAPGQNNENLVFILLTPNTGKNVWWIDPDWTSHNVLHHRMQENLCCSTWRTSFLSFFTDLGISCFSHIFSFPFSWCVGLSFSLLTMLSSRCHHCHWQSQPWPVANPSWTGLHWTYQTWEKFLAVSQRGLLVAIPATKALLCKPNTKAKYFQENLRNGLGCTHN